MVNGAHRNVDRMLPLLFQMGTKYEHVTRRAFIKECGCTHCRRYTMNRKRRLGRAP